MSEFKTPLLEAFDNTVFRDISPATVKTANHIFQLSETVAVRLDLKDTSSLFLFDKTRPLGLPPEELE